MKIALLFDGASALGATPDLLILATVEAVERVLEVEGNAVVRVPVNTDGRWVERVRRGKFDLAMNLCEGIDGIPTLEPSVISALEVLGIPFTGSSSWTTSLCLRKHVVNTLLDRSGFPIPRFAVIRRNAPLPTVGFPAICKPAAEDASIGIEQRSVVRNVRQLATRAQEMLEGWDEILVQRFIDGREVNVGIVGDTVLPVAEICFDDLPKGMWRIVSYRSKWETGSDEDRGARPVCPAPLEPELAAYVKDVALAAWRTAGGEGYGRVDMRIDRAGRPWILEVNANPDIAPDAGLARMALAAGLDYGALICQIAELGMDRARRGAPQPEHWVAAQRLSGQPAPTPAAALDLFAVGQR